MEFAKFGLLTAIVQNVSGMCLIDAIDEVAKHFLSENKMDDAVDDDDAVQKDRCNLDVKFLFKRKLSREFILKYKITTYSLFYEVFVSGTIETHDVHNVCTRHVRRI